MNKFNKLNHSKLKLKSVVINMSNKDLESEVTSNLVSLSPEFPLINQHNKLELAGIDKSSSSKLICDAYGKKVEVYYRVSEMFGVIFDGSTAYLFIPDLNNLPTEENIESINAVAVGTVLENGDISLKYQFVNTEYLPEDYVTTKMSKIRLSILCIIGLIITTASLVCMFLGGSVFLNIVGTLFGLMTSTSPYYIISNTVTKVK